jgi:hypothetical protein
LKAYINDFTPDRKPSIYIYPETRKEKLLLLELFGLKVISHRCPNPGRFPDKAPIGPYIAEVSFDPDKEISGENKDAVLPGRIRIITETFRLTLRDG